MFGQILVHISGAFFAAYEFLRVSQGLTLVKERHKTLFKSEHQK